MSRKHDKAVNRTRRRDNEHRDKVIPGKSIIRHSLAGWSVAGILGLPGILLLQIPGFSNLIAAQITVAVTGLIGGLSYPRLLKSLGGGVSPQQFWSVSTAWAASLVLGVATTFLVSLAAPKSMVFTFFSFTAWGTLGGLVTARVWRRLIAETRANDPLPALLVWSVSLGLALAVSEALSEYLKSLLPAWLAWALAYEAMAVLIGVGGGYAVVMLYRSRKAAVGISPPGATGALPAAPREVRADIAVFLLLCLPFYLNDFANIYVKDWRIWLAIDYIGVKLFPLLIIGLLLRTGKMKPGEFGLLPTPAVSFLTVFLIGTLVGIFLDQNGQEIISRFPGYRSLGEMPAITNPFWSRLDLTAGLLMVGIVEELVFRGYLCTFLFRYTRRPGLIIGLSALAFGLIHWSGGLHQVAVTGTIGAIFMALYLRTGSLYPLILAHFIIDFISFGDIFPPALFKFF